MEAKNEMEIIISPESSGLEQDNKAKKSLLLPEDIRSVLLKKLRKNFYCSQAEVFSDKYLQELQQKIMDSPYLSVNNLNRDFVSTRGFSVVFRRTAIARVLKDFTFFNKYLELALDPDCNAFYLNPLQLGNHSRVDPHIDRSLRSYLKTIEPPLLVSVLYLIVPGNMDGGELVLTCNKKRVGEIKPRINTLVYFQGHLTHSVNQVKSEGFRLSLVCEQYSLSEEELAKIPEYTIESRKAKY